MGAIPANISAPCPPAVEIQGPLTAAEAETLWGKDRANLARCRTKHGAVVTYAQNLGRNLAGSPK